MQKDLRNEQLKKEAKKELIKQNKIEIKKEIKENSISYMKSNEKEKKLEYINTSSSDFKIDKLNENKDDQEKKILEELCINIVTLSKKDLIILQEKIKKLDFQQKNKFEYINKITHQISKLEKEELDKLCNNLIEKSEEECLLLKSEILNLNFNSKLRKEYVKVIDERLKEIAINKLCYDYKIKNKEELKNLKQKLQKLEINQDFKSQWINKIEEQLLVREDKELEMLCSNIENKSEEECNIIKEKIINLKFSPLISQKYITLIDNQLQTIWNYEDSTYLDELFLNTNLESQKDIENSIKKIENKGRTRNKELYITALKNYNEKNIKRAKKYLIQQNQDWKRKYLREIVIFVVLFILKIIPPEFTMFEFIEMLLICYSICFYKRCANKKAYEILTLGGRLIHPYLKESEYIKSN